MKTHICEIERGDTVRIAELRRRAGYTQKELADKLNVDQSAVSLWESGKTKPLRKLHQTIAQVLGCTVDELLKEE